MKLTEVVTRLKEKKIDRRDLTIGILLFLILAMAFFGWYYFRVKKNPFTETVFKPNAKFSYMKSIYDPRNLKRPLGVAVSSWGDVFIADSVNHRIAVFDNNGKFIKNLGSPGGDPGQYNYPSSVAVSGKKLYVADFYNQRVQVVDFDGKSLSVIPAARDRQKIGANIMPITVAVDSKDNLYVSDLAAQQILVFDGGGNFIRSFGKPGSNPGELSYVNGIAVDDKKGKIYLSNSNNARVDEYTLEGEFVQILEASKNVVNPKGLAIDPQSGKVYVADTFAHKVVGIDDQGKVFETIGKRGFETGDLNFPNGVAFDEEGRLYIADRENNRVEVYSR